MSRVTRNLSIILRSERLITQRQLAVLRKQTALMVAAGVVAALGIIMLNASAYLALSGVVSPPAAALIVALVNIALALVLASVASNTSAEHDVAPVKEVRDMAIEDLEAEVQAVADEAKETVEGIQRMARDPFGMAAPGLISAAAKALVKSARS